jgi:tetratricopeptide (TPR) repeat protein
MLPTKVIFKGRLDFGSTATVARMLPQLETRIVTFYKEDFPWKLEELFEEDASSLVFKPVSTQLMDRTWKHGIDALNWMAQYALCGEILAVKLGEKKQVEYIKPIGEKATVMYYKHASETEDMEERKYLLDEAIKKYNHHIDALLLRADLFMDAGNHDDARDDLLLTSKCDPDNPAVHYRMARHNLFLTHIEDALRHSEAAISKSMPMEKIHWKARILKGKILRALGQDDAALAEWRLVETRLIKNPDMLPGKLAEVQDLLLALDPHSASKPPAAKGAPRKPKKVLAKA